MLLYILLNNVVTVIPLVIKGVAIIVIGRQRYVSVGMRFTVNVRGRRPPSAGMEMWAAECGARDSVLTICVVFVVLALLFIGIGISLEFVAKNFLDKRNVLEAGKRDEVQPFSLWKS